jgi:myosin heavy subunit
MQGFFVQELLVTEQREYEAQGLPWAHVAHNDNAETLRFHPPLTTGRLKAREVS